MFNLAIGFYCFLQLTFARAIQGILASTFSFMQEKAKPKPVCKKQKMMMMTCMKNNDKFALIHAPKLISCLLLLKIGIDFNNVFNLLKKQKITQTNSTWKLTKSQTITGGGTPATKNNVSCQGKSKNSKIKHIIIK